MEEPTADEAPHTRTGQYWEGSGLVICGQMHYTKFGSISRRGAQVLAIDHHSHLRDSSTIALHVAVLTLETNWPDSDVGNENEPC